MAEVKIQLNTLDGSLWYKNNIESLTEEELAEVKESAGEFWWTDNDEIVLLTVNLDDSYDCERRKKVWSYRNGTYTYTYYKFLSATQEEVNEFSQKLLDKFDELRIKRLKKQTDKISGILVEQYNGLIDSFKSIRSRMLIDTDWTQLVDTPLSDEDKELYRKFRQYLRDMTEDPAWIANDVFNVDFPITPKVYLKKDPNREVEYLSIPEHFENQATLKAKFRLARVYKYLELPGLFVSDEEWEKRSYEDLKFNLDKYLKKINSDLEFNISFKVRELPENYGDVTGHASNPTIDQINEIT
jgi:hypothetical protein